MNGVIGTSCNWAEGHWGNGRAIMDKFEPVLRKAVENATVSKDLL